MNYFSHLYFTLDVEDVLTSVGIEVKVGNITVEWAHDLGAFGGDKEQLDATPLISTVRINKSGIEDREAWTIEYFHNDTEYAGLNGLKTAGTSQNIEVKLPDGAKFTNTGVVTGNYMTEVAVNSMLTDKCTIDLSGEWTYTPATP